MLSIIPIIIFTIIFLRLNKFYQFTILSLSALLPFSLGDFMSIPGLLIVEWLTIIVFIMLMNELVPLHSLEKRIKIIKFRGIEIFIFALLILITWTIVNYINYEMLYKSFKAVETKTGTKRLYFNIFNNILLFFTTIIFSVVYHEKIDFEKFFKILFTLSFFIGIITILSYFFEFNMPLLEGTFSYLSEFSKSLNTKYGGQAYRFGGMAETVTVGIPALFAYYIIKKKLNLFVLLVFLFFVFMSGGRTLMIGVIFAITIFSFIFLPRNFVYLISAAILFLIVAAIFLPQSVVMGQLGRLTSLDSGSFLGQDTWRGLAWRFFLDNFQRNPIFGKGIGVYEGFIYSSLEGGKEFASQMLFSGGHGSYMSLLSTFGLGGITYFLIMLFGGIFLSFRKIKQYIKFDPNKTAIGIFCFMLLIIKAVDFITAGNGLTDAIILFYTVGMIASLTVLQNRKEAH